MKDERPEVERLKQELANAQAKNQQYRDALQILYQVMTGNDAVAGAFNQALRS